MSTHDNPLGGLRSSLGDAAFAVEERVLWRGKDGMKTLLDAARWPFERAAWALERAVIWPLEERAGASGELTRASAVAALALLAIAVGVLGLLWASSGGGTSARPVPSVAQTAAPAPAQPTPAQPAPATPVLHGAQPNFKLEGVGANARVDGGSADVAAPEAGAGKASASASSASAKPVKAGPAATKVAHRFANAFVLYEIGQNSPQVRTAFGETATPRLAQTLLRRPPRLPANAKVPKAEVLNVVPGPRHEDTYTLSVSLLRLGVTSELRLDMQRNKQSGKWQVTDARG
jgi:hypothetical protein